MEKPDDKGFIHISWPSKNIPHGGIFHSKPAVPSLAQQNFLEVLLEESKLTLAQRRKGAYTLRQEDKKAEPGRPLSPRVRPRTSRRRSLSAIRESGILDVDQYRPVKRGEDREKLKESLAHKMAYGDKEQRPPPPPRLKRQVQLPTKKEQWNDLVTQIRERADWLAEMEHLGHGGPYRDLVQEQIAERLRALDALGIDSRCSTARFKTSSVSERTARSSSVKSTKDKQPKFRIPRLKEGEFSCSSHTKGHSQQSTSSSNKQEARKLHTQKLLKEENVLAYEKLKYSPRRRV